MSIEVPGRANSSRDYVDTYAVERQRAAKPRIGPGSSSAVRGLAIAACNKTLSASADLATPERMSRNYARVLRRGEVAITSCYSSRAAASRCRSDINLAKTLDHGHQRPARMYTKVDQSCISTAAR